VVTGWLLWLLGPGRVEGLEHMPREGGCIVVSNHCSNLDPPFIGAAVGHRSGRVLHFMAKVEMRRWPIAGWLASQAGVFFVRRGEGDRNAQRMALRLLAGGSAMCMFPEGTRSRDGQLKEGKSGAALLAMRAGVPLVPVGISGSHRLFPGRSRIPHRHPINIKIGEPFRLPEAREGRIDRATLAAGTERIMREIAALLPAEQRGRWG
jgi:1-acyl-sn-glycerol-3-phosphate acyltransferase